jgi:hypothetical protein
LRLDAFHDRAANAELSSRIEEHLEDCLSCDGALMQLRALRTLLLKSSIPAPSVALSRGLMEAFYREHKSPAKTIPWWRRALGSSITVPAPALAAAMIVIAFGIAAANIIGRNAAATVSVSDATSAASTSVPPSPSISPEIIEHTKIVEVPVVKERVVTRVVYVEREERTPILRVQKQPLISAGKGLQRSEPDTIPKDVGLTLNGSVAENGYFTRIDLTGFQPTNEMKARIVREDKPDEK